jgi:hypothetical protein
VQAGTGTRPWTNGEEDEWTSINCTRRVWSSRARWRQWGGWRLGHEELVEFLAGSSASTATPGALGINKATQKGAPGLKQKDELAADAKALKLARRKRHRLKREIRRAIVRSSH